LHYSSLRSKIKYTFVDIDVTAYYVGYTSGNRKINLKLNNQ